MYAHYVCVDHSLQLPTDRNRCYQQIGKEQSKARYTYLILPLTEKAKGITRWCQEGPMGSMLKQGRKNENKTTLLKGHV